jgi:hypothetical protein
MSLLYREDLVAELSAMKILSFAKSSFCGRLSELDFNPFGVEKQNISCESKKKKRKGSGRGRQWVE